MLVAQAGDQHIPRRRVDHIADRNRLVVRDSVASVLAPKNPIDNRFFSKRTKSGSTATGNNGAECSVLWAGDFDIV
jgi:hypothetical protein